MHKESMLSYLIQVCIMCHTYDSRSDTIILLEKHHDMKFKGAREFCLTRKEITDYSTIHRIECINFCIYNI